MQFLLLIPNLRGIAAFAIKKAAGGHKPARGGFDKGNQNLYREVP